ncbi:HAD family phosphatase [Streptomyces sp. NPDC101151]|uniref:HAD family phosphatase n=1 Tax=Streptomyces sp. NPDC101151 TaxID=3366115 RepID=UPI0037FB975C
MGDQFARLRLAALNIDGVLLNDTFSPVIHHFVVSRGASYTADTERAIFSQPRAVAARRLAEAVGGSLTADQVLTAYFAERDDYLAQHPVAVDEGVPALLHRLRALGLGLVCYGGLPEHHFETHLGAWADLFDGPGYVCTDAFRPGLHEITTEIFGLKHDQAVFVDDVARVGEEARMLGMPFIGRPSRYEHGFQRESMRQAGVRHIVDGLDAIDGDLLRTVDAEAAAGRVWEA